MDETRLPKLVALIGAGIAIASLPLAATADGPYLSSAAVDGWIVVFAVGLFVALFAAPFALERSMRPAIADRDRRWERALLAWAAISLGVLAAGALVGLAGDFSGGSLAGAVGLVAITESVLVLGTMIFWMLSG